MASDVDIANLALARISQDQIVSLDDNSPAARFCKAFYSQTRDEVLQSNPWRFATTVATLSQLNATPHIEWDYQYQLPSDCLRVLALNKYGYKCREGYYEVQGKTLLTNDNSAIIKYIQRVTDGTLFHPLFIEALACKLAARVAKPLTGDDNLASGILTEFARLTGPEARRMDAYVGRNHPELPYVNSALVASRRGGC